jgi:hypothetical protein
LVLLVQQAQQALLARALQEQLALLVQLAQELEQRDRLA